MDEAKDVVHESRKVPTRRLTGRDAVRAHCTLLGGLGLCAVAFWFELGRAEGGNELSWAYVFEWPLLGVFGVYMWWNILDPQRHDHVRAKKKQKELAPEFRGMLSAWEEHQRDLSSRQAESTRPSTNDPNAPH